jgi:hypothetical protein
MVMMQLQGWFIWLAKRDFSWQSETDIWVFLSGFFAGLK